jgi:hypothetical protein
MSGLFYFPFCQIFVLPDYKIIVASNTRKPGRAFDLPTPVLSPFITGGVPGTELKIGTHVQFCHNIALFPINYSGYLSFFLLSCLDPLLIV